MNFSSAIQPSMLPHRQIGMGFARLLRRNGRTKAIEINY